MVTQPMPVMPRHDLLPVWYQFHIDMYGHEGDDLAALKKALASRDVNSRGWRLYLDYGDALFQPLRSIWEDGSLCTNKGFFAATWLKLLQACEMDVLPPPVLVRSIERWRIPEQKIEHLPSMFLRAVWKACIAAEYVGESQEKFVETQVVPLAEWFFGSGSYRTMEKGQLKAGWESLWKKYRDTRLAKIPEEEEWSPFLRRVEYAGHRFVALASESALKQEGQIMSHCIGDYGDRCRYEMLRAWSVLVAKTGQRVATLTVREIQPGEWAIDGLSGYRNETVTPRTAEAAMGVVWAMEDGYARMKSLRAEVDAARKLRAARPVRMDDIDDDDCDFFF